MKLVKHSKFKNTGILFELLVRQVTADTMSNASESKAMGIIKRYFSKTTELSKELQLYQSLVNESFSSETKANILIDSVVAARKRLNNSTLNRQKYNLIREISQEFNTNDFFATRIPNYKTYASIFKLFEYRDGENVSDIVKSRISLVEHLIRKDSKKVRETQSDVLTEFSKQPKDIRTVSYNILVERFNEKYGALNVNQRRLLREYINNISNTNNLKEYVVSEAAKVEKLLTMLLPKVSNPIIKIKLSECISLLERYKGMKRVTDKMVLGLLNYQELAHTLYKLDGDKK